MSVEDQQYGLTLFLLLEEYGGKHDGAVAMVALGATALNTHTGLGACKADWRINERAFLNSAGSPIPTSMMRRQFLEALRTHTHGMTSDPPRAPRALMSLHNQLLAKTLTPDEMFAELMDACNALKTFGIDAFANNKVKTDIFFSTTTTCDFFDISLT